MQLTTTPHDLTALNDVEEAELKQLEFTINEGLETFREVGQALVTIREKKLYRGQFSTFEKYIEIKWGISTRRAYQLCDAAEVVQNIEQANVNHGSQILPTSERQTRELKSLPPEKQVEAWNTVVEETDGKPTAQALRRHVAALAGVSVQSLDECARIKAEAPEKLEQIISGEKTISQVKRELNNSNGTREPDDLRNLKLCWDNASKKSKALFLKGINAVLVQ